MGTPNDIGAEILAPFGKIRSNRSTAGAAKGNLRKGTADGMSCTPANRLRQLKKEFCEIFSCRQ
jgi:hypothetical protein